MVVHILRPSMYSNVIPPFRSDLANHTLWVANVGHCPCLGDGEPDLLLYSHMPKHHSIRILYLGVLVTMGDRASIHASSAEVLSLEDGMGLSLPTIQACLQ